MTTTSSHFTYEESLSASTSYFNGNELAARVFLDKYALRDNDQNLVEKTPDDMHRRIAKEFARIEKKKFKKPLSEDEIYQYLYRFKKIIPQGSPMYGIGNPFQTISLSNCFVVESPLDSYAAICKADEELAQIAKRRGGDGVDVANIRPSGAITHNAARTATGTIPFCGRFSNTIREVGQNGRRGALMITQSIHHPESVIPWDPETDGEEFFTDIKDKDLGEFRISSKYYNPKRLDFATMKYDRKKVTGANVSLRVSDEFLNAVEKGEKFQQRWPVNNKTNPTIEKIVDAKTVWDKIIYSAWQTAEPGVLFWDNIIRESVPDCYAAFGFETICTNPCGEIPLSAYDSCRLLLLNLFGFVLNPFTPQAKFDWKGFYEAVQVAQRLMDDLVDLEEECILKIIAKIETDPEPDDVKCRELNLWKKILKACRDGRRTGTGITALGDALAAIGVGYGSEDGIYMTDRIYKTLKFGCYRASVDMAKELGAFPVWDHELEKNNPFLRRIQQEEIEIGLGQFVFGDKLWDDMQRWGRRNIACMTTAPAGSVSLVAGLTNYFGTSSGIEPEYDVTPYTRKKKGNPGDKDFRVDEVDQNGDHWMHFKVYSSALQEWMDATGESDHTKSPFWNHCASQLDWTIRVRLQAAAQKHVDHSISSTVNLPNDVTIEKVDEIYRTAWKAGCKGITVYRDGCRTGVLVKEKEKTAEDYGFESFKARIRADLKPEQQDLITDEDIRGIWEDVPREIEKTHAPKRPQSLPCDVHHVKVKGEEYFVLVGKLPNTNEPYEVFAGKNGHIPNFVKTGTIIKKARGKYRAVLDEGPEIESVSEYIEDEEEAVTRMVSTALRHGADVSFVTHQLEKTRGSLLGFSKAMARALKKYIKDGTEVKGEACEQKDCGATLVRSEGCVKCPACGWTKCG